MKGLSLTLVLLAMSICANAQTENSKLIARLQSEYADQGQSYPILIVDQDEVDLRYALNDALGSSDEKEEARVQIFKEYILEKTGVDLTLQNVSGLETYTSVLKEGAYAIPQFESYSSREYQICLVFPASVNSNQRLETHRILGLDTPGAYDRETYDHLKEKIPYNILTKYSILHELGHCLDRTFMPAAYASYEPSGHSVHLSESFAEAFATFMLIKEGEKNFAQTRALFRNFYTRHMGQWFVDHPQNGFGNPLYLQGGVIYYLSPVLLQANYVIKRKRDLKDYSVLEYRELAEEIVNGNALHFRSFQGIYRTFGEDTEDVLTFYRNFAYDSPDLFKGPYEEILGFLSFSPYLETKLWSEEANVEVGQSDALIDLETLDLKNLVKDYQQNPTVEAKDQLFSIVQLLRENLEQAQYLPYEEQVDRKKILDHLWSLSVDTDLN